LHDPATVSGVLVLDKPTGITSAATVTRCKRVLGVRRAGHAGTLDPMATGVLVVCLGEATKIASHLLVDDKRYLATAHLGEATDTFDADGTVVERAPVPDLSEDPVRRALAAFVGRIEQTPPAFSAIKQGGRPLYSRARRGEVVEVPVRTVDVRSLELVSWIPPDLTFRVDCGKGTYVRSLAVDVARRLGTVAHLTALRRERSGPFGLDRAIPWDRVQGGSRETLLESLIPPAAALADLPSETVPDAGVLALGRGQPVPGTPPPVAGPVRLLGPAGTLVAIGEWREGRIWPVRVLLG
jgi:tRNA pseudouridine55 synthase